MLFKQGFMIRCMFGFTYSEDWKCMMEILVKHNKWVTERPTVLAASCSYDFELKSWAAFIDPALWGERNGGAPNMRNQLELWHAGWGRDRLPSCITAHWRQGHEEGEDETQIRFLKQTFPLTDAKVQTELNLIRKLYAPKKKKKKKKKEAWWWSG